MDSRAILRVDIVGLTRVLIWDPCPFGLPEILTRAHVRPGLAFSRLLEHSRVRDLKCMSDTGLSALPMELHELTTIITLLLVSTKDRCPSKPTSPCRREST